MKKQGYVLNLLVVVAMLLGAATPAAAAAPASTPDTTQQLPGPGVPITVEPIKHDTSPALNRLAKETVQDKGETPEPIDFGGFSLLDTKSDRVGASVPDIDAALQTSFGVNAMPEPLANFNGIANTYGVAPPDTQGEIGYDPATGKKYYVQWVNLGFQVWDVTNPASPISVLGPLNGNVLFNGFGGACETANDGDPITLYDPIAKRWMMSQFALPTYPSPPFLQCIAVSVTGDPTGAWYRYAYEWKNGAGTGVMNDYPKFGVWPDGYYMSANQFSNGSWAGTGVAAFEREKMLTGAAARMVYFDMGVADWGGILPSDLDGLMQPAAGTPNYFIEAHANEWDTTLADELAVYAFDVDWNTTSNSTFTQVAALPLSALDASMCVTPTSYSRDCIPQQGTTQKLDAIAERTMYRLAYRNFGGHEAFVGNFTVDATGADQAGIRWFEVRKTGSTWELYQDGTYAPNTADGTHRWMGSIAQDHNGNIALGYSVSSTSMFPSIRYTGRLASDPLGQMPQGEVTLYNGTAAQTGVNRWGDYSMMSVDPVDDCTFWYTTETSTGSWNWATRIGAFKFPSCALASGTLTGLVTDDAGAPIAGATVQATMSVTYTISTVTAADGTYTMEPAPGTYSVTASKYGFLPETVANVVVVLDETTTQNFSLDPAPSYTVSGQVTDATTGWPLYARVDIAGYPDSPIWTNPEDGTYSVSLVAGTEYAFTASAWVPGYEPETISVGPLTGDATQDFALSANLATCSAPGYSIAGGYEEKFDGVTAPALPAGWAQVDTNLTNGEWSTVTSLTSPAGSPHSAPNAAKFNSYNASNNASTRLYRTAGLNMPLMSSTDLKFWMYHDPGYTTNNDRVQVQVSTDAGATWIDVGTPFARYAATASWEEHTVSLAAYAAETDLRIALHGISAYGNNMYVDDLSIGSVSCMAPADGGLVVGNVYESNNGDLLPGAVVTNAQGDSVVAQATLDPDVEDAFYTIFAPSGDQTLSASMPLFNTDSDVVTVVDGDTVWHDFSLGAGMLTATPASLEATLGWGTTTLQDVLANAGSGDLEFSLVEANLPYVPAVVTGPFAPEGRNVGPKRQADLDSAGVYPPPGPEAEPLAAGDVVRSWPVTLALPWGIGYDTLNDKVWISNPSAGGGDNLNREYETNGTATGSTIDTAPWIGAWAADMTYDATTGMLWQVNVSGDNCIYELDPVALTHTGNKICPAFGTSMRGLAYDPVSDTFYAGSWTNQILYHFNRDGVILDSKNVALGIAGLAFNPSNGHLFVQINGAGADIYVVDTTNAYAVLGSFSIAGLNDGKQGGLEADCDGQLWSVSQEKTIFEVESGETGFCAWMDIPWLTVSPTAGTLAPAASANIDFVFDSAGLTPGTYVAHVKAMNNTPYGTLAIPVTLNVEGGTLEGIVSNAETDAPVPFATVTVQPGDYTTTTDAAGFYSFELPTYADYAVTAEAFGYEPLTHTGVAVTVDATTTHDMALTPLPAVIVSGTVMDASGHGWPLYAKVEIDGYPGGGIFTDPVTGYYEVSLPEESVLDFTVTSVIPGYQAETRTVTVGNVDQVEDFELLVDATCSAPGYTPEYSGVSEGFENATFPPTDWTVHNIDGGGTTWARGTTSPHTGTGIAVHAYSTAGMQDGWLISPPLEADILSFWEYTNYTSYYYKHSLLVCDTANDCSAPPTNYTEIATFGAPAASWRQQNVSLAAYSGQTIRLAFRYQGNDADDWRLDDVTAQNVTCLVDPGGLVVGNVINANTGLGENGATVSSDDEPADTTTTFATPEDAAVEDGFYYLFSSLTGDHNFTASKTGYTSDQALVTVVEDDTVGQDFLLTAPLIAVDAPDLSANLLEGEQTTLNMTVSNAGSAPLDWQVTEEAPVVLAQPSAASERVPAKEIFVDRPGKANPYENLILDGSFEGGSPNAYWDEYSENFGTPLCDASCVQPGGTAHPRTGSWWAWFGGSSSGDTGSISQSVTLQPGKANILSFYMYIDVAATGANDYMKIFLDSTEVYAANVATVIADYQLVEVDLSAYADGAAHVLKFEADTAGSGNIHIDDVELNTSGSTSVCSPDALPWVSVTPNAGTLAGGAEATLAVTFDSTGMTPGVHTGQLCLESNDAANPVIKLPVELMVMDYQPAIDVMVNHLVGMPGETVEYTLYVTNTGNMADTFDLTMTGNLWTSEMEMHQMVLDPGEGYAMSFSVTIPSTADGGSTDTATIMVASHSVPEQTDSVAVTTHAQAVYGVEVTPATAVKSGLPGSNVSFTLTVANTGNADDTYDLTFTGNTWAVTVPATVAVAAGETEDVTVVVTVPAAAEVGASDSVTVKATSQADDTVFDSSSLSTFAGDSEGFGVELTPATDAKSGKPNTAVEYALTLTNVGSATDTFALTFADNAWDVELSATSVELAAGASEVVTVTVMIPAGTAADTTDAVTVTATSEGDDTQSAESTLTTTVLEGYGVILTPATDAASALAGETVTYTLHITNAGNLTDTFTLAVAGNEWEVSLSETSIELGVGEGAEVVVVVTIPADAAAEASDVVTITATSEGDETVTASSELTTSVPALEEYSIFMPFIHK